MSQKLPDYLYARRDPRTGKTYYRYWGPDGRWYGLGTDRREAIRQARDANLRRVQEPAPLWQRIERDQTPTVAEWAETYEQLTLRKAPAENTRRSRLSRLRRITEALGDVRLTDLTTRHVDELLEAIRSEGKHRLAQAVRSEVVQMLNRAVAAGHITSNVAEVTYQDRVTVHRERLTLETFLAIHEAAAELDPWVQRSMELALVSGQPREVVAAARWQDVEDGWWWCHRGKTGVQLKIPLSLRLQAVGWTLEGVVRACRDPVVSRYLIHHSRPRTHSKPGDPVHLDTISRRFADARKRAGIDSSKPPTFHEIRSLAERLYADQGVDTQQLLGHRDPRTTAIYQDRRGAEWIEVRG